MMKCKDCKALSYAIVETKTDAAPRITDEKSGEWVPCYVVECRGLDILEWCPGNSEWTATAASNAKPVNGAFHLTSDEPEWYEVDAETGNPISITNAEWRVTRG